MEAFCRSAWLGLNSYQESDSPRFFGRNEESDRLVEAIGENGLCTVFGPSGAGKTSLLLAGVFPRLRRSDFFPVYLRFDHEKGAARYVRQVVDALDGAVQKASFAIRETAPSVLPTADETLWEWFHRHLFLDDCLNPIRPVLMIDQFEEIFTKGLERRGAEEVQAFFTELTDLCTNNIPQIVVRTVEDGRGKLEFDHENCNWRLVVSLREDFLPRLEEVSHDHPVFRKMRQSVSSLTRDQALQAVRGPGGELVDEPVANAIVDAVGRSASGRPGRVEPALLSLFCSRLDIARQQKGLGRITPELLAASGKDILAGFYAETMGQVSERTAELIEDHLLTAGGYRDSWAEEDAKHAGVLQSEIDTLVNARLLHVDHRGGVCWLEFSHDILTSVALTSRDGRRQRKETEVLQAKLRRQRAHTRRVTGLLVALVALLAVSSVTVWHLFYREYAPCYLRTVKVFGRFQGIGEPLSESDKRQAPVYFKLRHHGRYSFHPHAGLGHWFEKSLVYRMEAIDGRGKPTTQHGMGTYLWNGEDVLSQGVGAESSSKQGGAVAQIQSSDEMKKVCAWEFDYGYDGRPLHEFGVDRDGKLVWSCTYAPCADENQWRSNTVVHFVNARGFPLQQRSDNAEYVGITYDAKTGFEHRYVFYDASGEITKGRDGAECQEQILNERGLRTRFTSLAWNAVDGRFTNVIDNAGNTGMWTEYLSNDMVAVSHSFGLQGEPRPTSGGVLVHRQEFDRFNRLRRQRLEGTNGVECAYEQNGGWSRIENDYYEDGVMRRTDIYAPPGCGGIWGITNVHHVVLLCDRRGNVCSQSYYGTNGQVVGDNSNVHSAHCEYETIAEKECKTKEWYLDANGCAVTNEDGIARLDMAYDSNGVQTNFDFYALEGHGGVWGYTNTYRVALLIDAQGNWTNECFYGVDGRPVKGNNNAHRTCRRFETIAGKNCEAAAWYLDENDRAVADENGVARVRTEYDQSGGKTRVDLYAPTGRCGIGDYEKVHHVIRLYDADGNEIEQSFWDVDGKPTAGNNRAAKTCMKYAKFGTESKRTEECYYDGEGNETADENGVARNRTEYDQSGRMTRVDLYAPKGRGGIWNYEKVHHVIRLYDADGNEIEQSFWDVDGKPTSGNEGVVKICRRFEGIGRCVEEWFPGTNDQLTTNCNGIARSVTKYEGGSCVIKQKLMFGMFGHGGLWGVPDLQLAIHDYDGRGNVVTQRCFSANGSLIACADGTAFVTVKHDERGQKRRIDGYAPVGKGGIWGYEKAHHVIRLYDADGNEVEQSFWDVDGKPTAGNNRAAKTCKRYAKFGDKFLCTEERYLDGEGNDTANGNGIARLQTAYDPSGKMTRMDHYAPKGCGGIWGCEALHHVVCHYDSNGKKAERYYGSNEHEINLVGVAMAAEIVQASQAEIRKVAIGDVVCGYGKYRLNASDCFDDLMASIQALGQCDKTLTIARKRGDDYEIKTFDFPPGPMGIRFVDRKLIDRDFEKIQRAYRLHLEKVKAKE